MKKNFFLAVLLALLTGTLTAGAQQRRPIDSRHPLWLIHVDVWNSADPQKIIDLIPDDIKPYVCMNLSLSCSYDKERNMYRMPRYAMKTYRSWATVCQHNGLWFTCQPASGGHTHIQDDDMATFEYFYKHYPNFLGWNYAEQFWGFDEPGDKSSSPAETRIDLFARLVRMAHQYGGFLTVSFCGNIWSHPLNPIGMMKRNPELLQACRDYPEAIVWLYKYTTSSCFYNNESVTFGPFISGLAKNYGVRYDNCGWDGAMEALFGKDNGKKYPVSAGIGTVMEQTAMNGGAIWDGPELIWTQDFQNRNNSQADGYTRRNWGTFGGFNNAWIDMFRKIIDGTLYIPTREETVGKTKVAVINDVNSGSDEERYAAWANLYDGLYKQDDPMNPSYYNGGYYEGRNGQMMANMCYFKKTGRYGTIPMVTGLYDDVAKAIPLQVKKSERSKVWSTVNKKTAAFDELYPQVSEGDLFVERFRNQLVTYTPYTYLNSKTTASATIPLVYNTCERLELNYGKLSSGLIREYADHIDVYLNNYRNDSTTQQNDKFIITGAIQEPTFTMTKRANASAITSKNWDAETGTFSLLVKHMGPVDVTIQCTGAATDRRTDVADSTPLGTPRQPEEYNGPVIIEAEDMDYKSVRSVAITNSGWYAPDMEDFAGNGYVEMGTSKNGSLRHQLKLRQGGDYDITVRYLATAAAGHLTLSVNGQEQSLPTEQTEGKAWKKATLKAQLVEGLNDLRINNTEGLNITIDQIVYAPQGTPEDRYQVTVREALHGEVLADVSEAAEGETVTLTVIPEEGYALTELRVVNSVFYSMSKTIAIDGAVTFSMPDDNVTIQPVFTDMTSVYKLDFTTSSSSMPVGWRCVQENNEVHQYPNNYSLGARMMSGFQGSYPMALYWRDGVAEYGRQADYKLTLAPGEHKLTFVMGAWKEAPRYKAQILTSGGQLLATSQELTARPSADGKNSTDLSSAETVELPFTVSEAGDYVISFACTSAGGGLQEFLLLDCRVNTVGGTTVIMPLRPEGDATEAVYNLQGVRLTSPDGSGIRIVRGRDGKTRKVIKRGFPM